MIESSIKNNRPVYGRGDFAADLQPEDLRLVVEESLKEIPSYSRVLAIVPDKTRDDNTDLLLPFAYKFLAMKKIHKLDVLIAQGTHAPMSSSEKRRKIGLGDGLVIPNLGRVYDHHWNTPADLIEIGELDTEKVKSLTGGLFSAAIPLTINKLLAPGNYDYVLIFGATVPHEVAGFAGGAKYFFPGISGAELTNATHWLGALAGIENIIGRIETPTRRLIEAAADFITPQIISLTSVVTRNPENRLQTHALFGGDFRLALRKAVEISKKVHIKYTGRKYKRVVALLDEHYDELWTAGKASYKLGGIIEDGGELIIYAPHLRCFSDTHGTVIERFGYSPIAKVKQMAEENEELQNNLCVAAHLAHVAFAGRDDNEFLPRYTITLASQIEEKKCRQVNLNYLDCRKFQLSAYRNERETLIVEKAGRDLYLPNP